MWMEVYNLFISFVIVIIY